MKIIVLSFFFIFTLQSCVQIVTKSKWAENIIEAEYSLQQDSVVVSTNCSLLERAVPYFVMQTEVNFRNNGVRRQYGCEPKIEHKVSKGERVYISKIQYFLDGSNGWCWVVKAYMKSKVEFFLPTCTFHYHDLWIKEIPPLDNKKENGFVFINTYLAPSKRGRP